MLISEKSFLERLASHVPGIAGYREREARRETDRRLRDWLARRVDEAASDLDAVRNRLTRDARLEAMAAVSDLDRSLKKTAAALRFADAGYGGLFDAVKVRESELAAIYAFDLSLVDAVTGLADRVRAAAEGDLAGEALPRLVAEARRLDVLVGRRRELFETPEEKP
jgi:hypothetical protein